MATTVEVLTQDQVQELEEIEISGSLHLDRAEALVITCAEDQQLAVETCQTLRVSMATVEAWFEPIIRPARQSLDATYLRKREAIGPRQAAIDVIQTKITVYRKRVLVDAQNAERKERRRREVEAAAARETAFDVAMDAGDTQRAEAIAEHVGAPVAAPPVAQEIMEREAPKLKGMAETKTWKARAIGDDEQKALLLLCKAIGEGREPTSYVSMNWPTLNSIAEATQGQRPVPGIEFYEDVQTQVRR